MLPEAKYIEKELVLRKMLVSNEIDLTRRSKVRWLALALGLINPNETRHHFLDVFEVLLLAKSHDKYLSIEEIAKELNANGKKMDEKTIYYHIQRLKSYGLVSKKGKKYILGREGIGLKEFLSDLIRKEVDESLTRIETVLAMIDL
jgi:predicted transcriptional regulator